MAGSGVGVITMGVVVVIQDGQAFMLPRAALAEMLRSAIAGQRPQASDFGGIGIGDGIADLTDITPLQAERVLAGMFAAEASGVVATVAA